MKKAFPESVSGAGGAWQDKLCFSQSVFCVFWGMRFALFRLPAHAARESLASIQPGLRR
jgi:hypothetical protein